MEIKEEAGGHSQAQEQSKSERLSPGWGRRMKTRVCHVGFVDCILLLENPVFLETYVVSSSKKSMEIYFVKIQIK